MTTWISAFLVKQPDPDLKKMGFSASMPLIVAFFSMYLGGWKTFPGASQVRHHDRLPGMQSRSLFHRQGPKGETNMVLLAPAPSGFFLNLPRGLMQDIRPLRYAKEVIGRSVGVEHAAFETQK